MCKYFVLGILLLNRFVKVFIVKMLKIDRCENGRTLYNLKSKNYLQIKTNAGGDCLISVIFIIKQPGAFLNNRSTGKRRLEKKKTKDNII